MARAGLGWRWEASLWAVALQLRVGGWASTTSVTERLK